MGDHLLTLEAFIATGTLGVDGQMHWLPSSAARIKPSLLVSLEKFINTLSDNIVKADANKAIQLIRANTLELRNQKETDSLGIAIGLYLKAVARAQDLSNIKPSMLEKLKKFINTFSDNYPFLVKADANKAIQLILANTLGWHNQTEIDSLVIAIDLYIDAIEGRQAVKNSKRLINESSLIEGWTNNHGRGRFIPPEWGGDDPLIQERPNNALPNAPENENIGDQAIQHGNNINNHLFNNVGANVNASIVKEFRQRRNRDLPAAPKRSRTGSRGGKHTRTRKHRSKRHTKRNRK
uniref:Uncharacterized protein n=1 Tax=viral metagenome TaxID=1070528 RepID=A0A6C0K0L4_9ZZZZ